MHVGSSGYYRQQSICTDKKYFPWKMLKSKLKADLVRFLASDIAWRLGTYR